MITLNSKPHRQNSEFQLRYFLTGDCKTPDGAWSLMYGQKIDMESKIRHADSQRLRREAKLCAARKILSSWFSSKSKKLDAEADIAEILADLPVWQMNLEAAHQELADIVRIMNELEPQRKYRHLSVLQATEASQRDEWLGELKTRAENFLLTQNSIPHDHLNTMRCHPDFKTKLVPYIADFMAKINLAKGPTDGLMLISDSNPLLLLNK